MQGLLRKVGAVRNLFTIQFVQFIQPMSKSKKKKIVSVLIKADYQSFSSFDEFYRVPLNCIRSVRNFVHFQLKE